MANNPADAGIALSLNVGACTVLLDGKRLLSCLTLAAQCEDQTSP
jgi:aerobic-type carbon monoxide dehydrogenase small subunit (CoxS/CutS family)